MRQFPAISSFRSAKTILCALAVLLLSASSFSGERTARFRAGNIISAEISSVKPEVLDESSFEPYKDMKGNAWAEVIVRLDKGRSIGVADYVLVYNGTEYKCLAIAEDDKIYSVRDNVFEKTNIFGAYRLLFPIQSAAADKSELDLRFKLLASPLPDVPLKFRNMGSSTFTESSKVPQEGSLGISANDIKALRKPAAPATPATTAPAPADPAKK